MSINEVINSGFIIYNILLSITLINIILKCYRLKDTSDKLIKALEETLNNINEENS